MSDMARDLPHIPTREREETVKLAGDVLAAAERIRSRLGAGASLSDAVRWGIAVLDLAIDKELQLRDPASNAVQVVDVWGAA